VRRDQATASRRGTQVRSSRGIRDQAGTGGDRGPPMAAAPDMDEQDAAIEGGQLVVPLLGSRSASTATGSPSQDASSLRRLYAGHALARWGARCVHSVISYVPFIPPRVFRATHISFSFFFSSSIPISAFQL
jgi:hypothetical protein